MDPRTDMKRLLSHSLEAFHAFTGLRGIAEDLRLLSLNAELAASRSGVHGRSMKALTQHTRELVHRLTGVEAELMALKSKTYVDSAKVLSRLRRLKLLDRASAAAAEPAARRIMVGTAQAMDRMGDDVHGLAAMSRRVEAIAAQAGNVATNIAIEAARANGHGVEFAAVSDTMRSQVRRLEGMTDQARRSVDSATRFSGRLPRTGSRAEGVSAR